MCARGCGGSLGMPLMFCLCVNVWLAIAANDTVNGLPADYRGVAPPDDYGITVGLTTLVLILCLFFLLWLFNADPYLFACMGPPRPSRTRKWLSNGKRWCSTALEARADRLLPERMRPRGAAGRRIAQSQVAYLSPVHEHASLAVNENVLARGRVSIHRAAPRHSSVAATLAGSGSSCAAASTRNQGVDAIVVTATNPLQMLQPAASSSPSKTAAAVVSSRQTGGARSSPPSKASASSSASASAAHGAAALVAATASATLPNGTPKPINILGMGSSGASAGDTRASSASNDPGDHLGDGLGAGPPRLPTAGVPSTSSSTAAAGAGAGTSVRPVVAAHVAPATTLSPMQALTAALTSSTGRGGGRSVSPRGKFTAAPVAVRSVAHHQLQQQQGGGGGGGGGALGRAGSPLTRALSRGPPAVTAAASSSAVSSSSPLALAAARPPSPQTTPSNTISAVAAYFGSRGQNSKQPATATATAGENAAPMQHTQDAIFIGQPGAAAAAWAPEAAGAQAAGAGLGTDMPSTGPLSRDLTFPTRERAADKANNNWWKPVQL